MFAEVIREQHEGSQYYTLRYVVYADDVSMIGTYGVHYNDGRAYGSSRDYHKLATERDIEQVRAYREWMDSDMEDDMPTVGWGTYLNECCYHDDKWSICDGSSIVEIITDNDQAAFEIAAMMAGVDRGE